ncbi:TPA: hypothetical protein KKW95_002908 [Legionella pneumophila]|nr:hypothetical protein [Legionella pneumophila]HAU1624355.1 hypothetical protein [Legionella pneumophila]HAW6255860.1 hypothetical protein [Legionella pneumophila]HBD7200239.1 hypothetical protein [Legionella pneumophila]HBD9373066.1 hypothetical protein [Legionella pneumophila]
MFSKYEDDMGFGVSHDFDISPNDSVENNNDSSPNEQTQVEVSNSSATASVSWERVDMNFGDVYNNDSSPNEQTQVKEPVNGFTFKDYCDTDYNEIESDILGGHGHLNNSDSASSSSSEKSHDPWGGPKALVSPVMYLVNVAKAAFKTVYNAARLTPEECENHEFQDPQRRQLHEETGGAKNPIAPVNIALDKLEKKLLPGAREAITKQEQKKENYRDEPIPPEDAVAHALDEFEIANKFGEGNDVYDDAGNFIHTTKGIIELAALDLDPFEGGVTSRRGFSIFALHYQRAISSLSFFKTAEKRTTGKNDSDDYMNNPSLRKQS